MSVNNILTKFGKELVLALEKSLSKKKDTTGRLRGSIKFRMRIFGSEHQFNLLMEDYYKWVDEGRPAGKAPPIEPPVLLNWIKKKSSLSLGKKQKLKEYQYKSLAFYVGRKIKRFGIKPTYFYSNVINDGRIERLKKDLSAELKKEVLIELKEI